MSIKQILDDTKETWRNVFINDLVCHNITATGTINLPSLIGPTGPIGYTGPTGSFTGYYAGNVIFGSNLGVTGTISTSSLVSQTLALPGYKICSTGITFNTSQLLNFTALNTPLTVVPAQGLNTVIRPLWCTINYVKNMTGFSGSTGATSDVLNLYFLGAGGINATNNSILATINPFDGAVSNGFGDSAASWMWAPTISLALNSTQGFQYPTGSNHLFVNTPIQMAHCVGGVNTLTMASNDWTLGDGSMYLTIQYAVISGLP